MSTLVDSSILIDHLRGRAEAGDFLDRLRTAEVVRASIMSRFELRAGASGASPDVDRFMADVHWEPVSPGIVDRAGAFARRFGLSHRTIGPIDYLIAATADVLDLELVTRNVRHFPMFPDLEPPY